MKIKKCLAALLASLALASPAHVFASGSNSGFRDVNNSQWFAAAAKYVSESGLMVGVEKDDGFYFLPEQPTTRAMIATILYNVDSGIQTNSSAPSPFDDVERDKWYTGFIDWAYNIGLVSGTGPNSFSPDSPVSREQLVTLLYRFSELNKVEINSIDGKTFSYTDGRKTSGWAKTAMDWAVSVGLISGKPIGTDILLDPKGQATRAEIASILQRYHTLTMSDNVRSFDLAYAPYKTYVLPGNRVETVGQPIFKVVFKDGTSKMLAANIGDETYDSPRFQKVYTGGGKVRLAYTYHGRTAFVYGTPVSSIPFEPVNVTEAIKIANNYIMHLNYAGIAKGYSPASKNVTFFYPSSYSDYKAKTSGQFGFLQVICSCIDLMYYSDISSDHYSIPYYYLQVYIEHDLDEYYIYILLPSDL